jgi:predicted RNase H-like HicB family nuclease
MASTALVQYRVKLEALTRQDGPRWVAWCWSLDIMSQSDSQEGALESLKGAIELWFESCIDRNVLDEALRECGFSRLRTGDTAPPDASAVGIRPRSASMDSFTQEHHIEVSIPAYIAAQQELRKPRASH